MTQRLVLRTAYSSRDRLAGVRCEGWVVKDGRGVKCVRPTQEEAVQWAVDYARATWRDFGRPAQVVLHGRNGRIRWERTYGRDPRRRAG